MTNSPFQIIAQDSNQQEGGAYVVLYRRDICVHVVQWVHQVPAQMQPHGFVRKSWIVDPGVVSKPPILTARNTHGPGLYQSSGWDWRNKIEYGYNTQYCTRRVILSAFPKLHPITNSSLSPQQDTGRPHRAQCH